MEARLSLASILEIDLKHSCGGILHFQMEGSKKSRHHLHLHPIFKQNVQYDKDVLFSKKQTRTLIPLAFGTDRHDTCIDILIARFQGVKQVFAFRIAKHTRASLPARVARGAHAPAARASIAALRLGAPAKMHSQSQFWHTL